ncbi:MAG: RHS repeat-associated core domain-containing protein [Bacteroidales bacterium]|jgi:RHS repeat-associated protein|nr:RHS repeat-associated core domain-containing protein [Bacteroidales bacterium]
MESAIVGDKGSTTLGKNGNTKLENNSLCRCQDYSMTDGLFQNTRIPKGGTPLSHPLPRVRKHERIRHHINNGSVSCYFYDAAGERTVKLTSETEMVHVNGKKVGGNDAVTKFTAYVSPYFVVSNGGAYTKHIYAASQRIASKLGNEDGFGADPRRVEQAGGKKISDFQKDNIGARYKELGFTYSAPEKEKVEKDSTMDSEEPENLVFFYHPDHLGSTSYVTDADGNIAQHVEYIPYGEVFVEERNNSFSTNYLFNAKELDNETGLYYYGARYLDPTGAMWLSVDPMWEKYAGMSPYNYCAGNPVKLVDPDGREITEGQNLVDDYKTDVKELKKSAQSALEKVQHKIQERVQNGKRTRHQEKEAHRLEDRINLYDQVLYEIDVLENSDQQYRIFEGNLGNPLGEYRSGARFNFQDGTFDITIAQKKKIAHELLHAFQFETGEFSTGEKGNPFYDQQDEIKAYERGSDIYNDNDHLGASTGFSSHVPYVRSVYSNLPENSRSYKDLKSLDPTYLKNLSRENKAAFRVNGVTYVRGVAYGE